jgi:hypothetical protein
VALGIEVEGVDRLGRPRLDPPVEVEDVLSGLGRQCVQVVVGVGVVVAVPRRRLRERPPERLAEVAGLHPGAVLHQAEQAGAGGSHRPARVVLRDALELPHQRVAGALEVGDERGLRPLGHPQPPVGR